MIEEEVKEKMATYLEVKKDNGSCVSEADILQMLYNGDFEELSSPPYVSHLMKALCDPESAASEMLAGYESNLSWDSIIETQVLSEAVIMAYIEYLDLDNLMTHQQLTQNATAAVYAQIQIEKEKKERKKYFKVEAPVYVVTQPESGVKKILDQAIVDCKESVDVIGRVCFVDESVICIDNSRHFRSIVYRIPIESILSIGYICDRPEVETVRDQLLQNAKLNSLKTFLVRDEQLTATNLESVIIEVDEDDANIHICQNKAFLVLTEQEARQYATDYIKSTVCSEYCGEEADQFANDLIASFGYDSYINEGYCKEERIDGYFIYELEELEEKYRCHVCGKMITNDEGITTLNGWWVCDSETCRTVVDDGSECIEKYTDYRKCFVMPTYQEILEELNFNDTSEMRELHRTAENLFNCGALHTVSDVFTWLQTKTDKECDVRKPLTTEDIERLIESGSKKMKVM